MSTSPIHPAFAPDLFADAGIATLGRLDKLSASGAFDQLLRSAARFAEHIMVLSEHSRDVHDGPDANVVSTSNY